MARFSILTALFACLALSPAFAQSPSDVSLIQQQLTNYGAGEADGIVGQKTRDAIRAYQRDWQIPETGEIRPDLIARLKREHPATKPQWYQVMNTNCKVWNEMPQAREEITWTGDCLDDLINGVGTSVWNFVENGATHRETFKGEFRKGKKYGYGVYIAANNDRYEGEWRNDDLNGRGVYTTADREQYEGEWQHGVLIGRGVYTSAGGDRYEGEFKDGELHGRGIFTATSGERFEGEWKGGELNGRGVFTAASGERYEGEWKDGKPHGQGIYIPGSGRREVRRWKNGCSTLNGQWRWINTTKKACGF